MMQTNMDSMSIMAQELCRALGIDVDSLFDTLSDQESSLPSANTASHMVLEMDRVGNCSHDL